MVTVVKGRSSGCVAHLNVHIYLVTSRGTRD
jgi:hypothetical protein